MPEVQIHTALTGGAAGALDAETDYSNGDIGFAFYSNTLSPYKYNASSTKSENSPFVIIPDDNISGTGAWEMQAPIGIASIVAGNWTIRTSAADNNWLSVAWSPELGLFCAVANSGTGNRVMTNLFFKA